MRAAAEARSSAALSAWLPPRQGMRQSPRRHSLQQTVAPKRASLFAQKRSLVAEADTRPKSIARLSGGDVGEARNSPPEDQAAAMATSEVCTEWDEPAERPAAEPELHDLVPANCRVEERFGLLCQLVAQTETARICREYSGADADVATAFRTILRQVCEPQGYVSAAAVRSKQLATEKSNLVALLQQYQSELEQWQQSAELLRTMQSYTTPSIAIAPLAESAGQDMPPKRMCALEAHVVEMSLAAVSARTALKGIDGLLGKVDAQRAAVVSAISDRGFSGIAKKQDPRTLLRSFLTAP